MRDMNKLMLWGAWAIMVAVGGLSVWKTSQTPKIEPGIVKLEKDFEKIYKGPVGPCGTSLEVRTPPNPFSLLVKVPERTHDWTAFMATKYVGVAVAHPKVPVFILSHPIPGEAKATRDEVTFSWTLAESKAELKSWMDRKEAKPTGFIILRQCEDGQAEEIAKVGPKGTSFTDLTAEPRLTYRYWVVATGTESDLTVDPPVQKAVTRGLNTSAEVRTPAASRLKLVGGDKANALLRAETYDKAQKKWVGKNVMVAPGHPIGSSGWTLKQLRFDNFTLVADVTDDEGVDRVLTTKD